MAGSSSHVPVWAMESFGHGCFPPATPEVGTCPPLALPAPTTDQHTREGPAYLGSCLLAPGCAGHPPHTPQPALPKPCQTPPLGRGSPISQRGAQLPPRPLAPLERALPRGRSRSAVTRYFGRDGGWPAGPPRPGKGCSRRRVRHRLGRLPAPAEPHLWGGSPAPGSGESRQSAVSSCRRGCQREGSRSPPPITPNWLDQQQVRQLGNLTCHPQRWGRRPRRCARKASLPRESPAEMQAGTQHRTL